MLNGRMALGRPTLATWRMGTSGTSETRSEAQGNFSSGMDTPRRGTRGTSGAKIATFVRPISPSESAGTLSSDSANYGKDTLPPAWNAIQSQLPHPSFVSGTLEHPLQPALHIQKAGVRKAERVCHHRSPSNIEKHAAAILCSIAAELPESGARGGREPWGQSLNLDYWPTQWARNDTPLSQS